MAGSSQKAARSGLPTPSLLTSSPMEARSKRIPVSSVNDLPSHDVLMLDVVPSIALEILGDRLPSRIARAYRSFSHGPGAFKVDFAVEGGIPWTAQDARRAGTVHVGGSFDEVAANERSVVDGKMPAAPFVLVGQQFARPEQVCRKRSPDLGVRSRAPRLHRRHDRGNCRADRTLCSRLPRPCCWHGGSLDDRDVEVQRELCRRRHHRRAGSPLQTVFRPRVSPNPYATGIHGVYLCSSSTPPSAGAHGMCGANAADRALTQRVVR